MIISLHAMLDIKILVAILSKTLHFCYFNVQDIKSRDLLLQQLYS